MSVFGRGGQCNRGERLWVDWQFLKRQMLQRSLDTLSRGCTQWVFLIVSIPPTTTPLPLHHCHSNHHGGSSFLHSWPHYFLFPHPSPILPRPPFPRCIDWHAPISKSLISTKPQGTHCLQQFSCSSQSCRAVRTHNDTGEWNPWWVLNIINVSWRWIWYPLLSIPLIAI